MSPLELSLVLAREDMLIQMGATLIDEAKPVRVWTEPTRSSDGQYVVSLLPTAADFMDRYYGREMEPEKLGKQVRCAMFITCDIRRHCYFVWGWSRYQWLRYGHRRCRAFAIHVSIPSIMSTLESDLLSPNVTGASDRLRSALALSRATASQWSLTALPSVAEPWIGAAADCYVSLRSLGTLDLQWRDLVRFNAFKTPRTVIQQDTVEHNYSNLLLQTDWWHYTRLLGSTVMDSDANVSTMLDAYEM